MNNMQAPARDLDVGDKIEHDLMPGFTMRIHDVRACEVDSAHPKEHSAYQITDPEDCTDWLCAYDVHPADATT